MAKQKKLKEFLISLMLLLCVVSAAPYYSKVSKEAWNPKEFTREWAGRHRNLDTSNFVLETVAGIKWA